MHEQNALPGLANKAGARIADVVAVSFPDTKLPKATYVGLPIRRMISQLDRAALRAEARAFFGLDPDRPTLLVTGGSQGARTDQPGRLRRRPGASVTPASRCCTSSGRTARPTRRPTGTPYVVVPFVDRMDLAYAAADLVVCRAGANSVTEAAATGLPGIFVPLPIGNGEQELNARPVVDAGGGLLLGRRRAHLRVGRRDRPRPGPTTATGSPRWGPQPPR